MRRQDFSYDLPEELIAYKPASKRTGSRLLNLNGITGELEHLAFSQILSCLKPGDVMVFNDTRVIPARLYGTKSTGGSVEILIERILDENRALAHIRASKSPKVGAEITLAEGFSVFVEERTGNNQSLFVLHFQQHKVLQVLDRIGHIPLPPYIDRDDEADDIQRYQTVYSREPGAVAAPTAGLHFDEAMMQAITDKGVEIVYVTLHVGAGTFQPVRVENIDEHVMHSELAFVPEDTCRIINQAKKEGRRVVAVGTTSVRSLEAAANSSVDHNLTVFHDETDIFITPGYKFKIVDALITNFHLSESTLLMLISAFAGYKHTMNAYHEAIAQRYRFFSYGDAMFITHNPAAGELFTEEVAS